MSYMQYETCKICNSSTNSTSHLIRIHHITRKEYYDMFVKKPEEGICKCGKICEFRGWPKGYSQHCSYKCANSDPIVKNKQTQSIIRKYGVKHTSQCKMIKEKKKKTFLKHYGVTNCFANTEIKEKIKETNIKKYGVENPSQNKDIIEKINKNCYLRKEYKLPSGKIIYKQGYEPNFLDYVFSNNLLLESEINYSPNKIIYLDMNNKERYYFPDFYIPKLNLIIEIKSWFTLSKDPYQPYKKKACVKNGYNYLLVVDNDFKKLLKLL